MNRRTLPARWLSVSLLLILTLLMAACGAETPTNTPVPPQATNTTAAAPTNTTAAAPTNTTAAAPTNTTAAAPTNTRAAAPTNTTAAAPTNTRAAAPTNTAGATGATGDAIVVGLMTDRSGPLAIYGPMLERGFELGLEYATGGTNAVNGRPIEVVVKDTASNVDTGVNLAREAIEQNGADLLVGVPSSGVALAVSGVAAQNNLIYIASPAASPDITGKNFSPYTFRGGRDSVQDALTMGAALVDLGDTFIQIAPDYAFGRGSAGAFYNVIKGAGGNFAINDTAEGAGTVFAPQDTTDFTPYLNQILDSGADVVVVTWAGAGFVPLFQQMQQLGIFDSMVVATGMGDNQTMSRGYADAVGSVGVSVYHYSLYDNEINNWLTRRHQEEHNTPPDLFTEGGFISAQMLVAALEETGGDPSAPGMAAALEGMTFDGPKGSYTIRAEDHALLQPMTLVKLTNTTDPQFRFFELVQKFEPADTAPPCAAPAELNRCK